MLILPPEAVASPDGYGQAARLLRPGLVDPALSPPSGSEAASPKRPIRTPEDVVEGLPLPAATQSEVIAAIGTGGGGFRVASHLRRILADQPPALVREVVDRVNRFAAHVRQGTPRPAAPVLGVAAALGLRKSGVIKVGPHGGQIIGYAHGDMKKPIYAGKNPEMTHAHVYQPGKHGAPPAEVQVHDAHGPYAWTADPAVAAAGPAVVHLPTGRVIKTVTPKPGAAGPKATASAAVKALASSHGTVGLDAAPGGFTSKADYAAMRGVIEAAEATPKAAPPPPPPASPAPATVAAPKAPKAVSAPVGAPLDKAAAEAIVAGVAAKTGMTPQAIRAALTAPDASTNNPAVAENRAAIEHAILTGGHARKHAMLELLDGGHHTAAAVNARMDAIGSGDVATLKKEYAATPVYDLQVLTGAKASGKFNPNGAVCYGSRHVEMGLGEDGKYVTGNFRHELGHAVMMAWGYQNGGTAPPKSPAGVILAHYKAALAKMKAAPKPPPGGYDHEWYEVNVGVIGSRALDTAHEDAAEHYRGYHREALRHRFKGGGQLDTYHQRHPEMGALWDARYTAALLASAAAKGVW